LDATLTMGSEQMSSPHDESPGNTYHKSIDPASSLGAMRDVQLYATSPDRLLGKRMINSLQPDHEKMLALVSGT
jgi:hypothetical protein